MQEVVQAIDDEDRKEKRRELSEIENYEKKETLKEIRKVNQEERRKGKLYIEALQRDQEIVFLSKLKDAGFLW
jgi:flagellar motor component MotA